MNTNIDEEKMLEVHPIPPGSTKSVISAQDEVIGEENVFDFELLKLIEKPSPNDSTPLLSLHDCEGYLKQLPLKPPNADLNSPKTIADMVNVLTEQGAEDEFQKELVQIIEGDEDRAEGAPPSIYSSDIELMKNLLQRAKKRSSHKKAPSVFGHVVKPGCISLYVKDGLTYAVTEGRWFLFSERARWLQKNVNLQQEKISPSDSTLLIVRVQPGKIGKIYEQGIEKLLDVGTHVFNSGTVTFEGTVAYNDNAYFHHGRYHYLRVARGSFGQVWAEVIRNGEKTVVPKLVDEGEHFIDSYLFKFDKFVQCRKESISHGSINRILVPKGYVAKVFQDTKPRLLGRGEHIIESTNFVFDGLEDLMSNEHITHGTITILTVTLGKVALAWNDNEPMFIDKPGLYEFDSTNFSFVEFKDAEERLIQLGSKKIILVQTGEIGVTYDEGVLKILDNGRHIISKSTHIFERFLSTQQKSLRLATLSASDRMAHKSMKKMHGSQNKFSHQVGGVLVQNDDSDLTVCETKDLVKVGLRADVFYSVEDPEKCIKRIDVDELEDLVRETAIATLTNIIRSTALNEIAQSKQVCVGEEKDTKIVVDVNDSSVVGDSPPPTAPMAVFFEKAHDEFMLKLHDDFWQRYGVDVANIRIESLKIMDDDLSESISQNALTTAQIENEMANLEGKSLISTQTERTAAEVKNINAQAEASALKTTADAANLRKIDAAKAEAESLKISLMAKAEAEAEAILIKAKAEAEAIKLKANAEADRAEMLSHTNLGQQEALLQIYSDMVVNSNQGVEKVIYMDPSVNRDSPFALSSLNNLNRDLHSLTTLGIAAGEEITPYVKSDQDLN